VAHVWSELGDDGVDTAMRALAVPATFAVTLTAS
jgi:hypothetical protein